METKEIKKLFKRISRINDRLNIKDGRGTSWDYAFENGEIHKYTVQGIKSPEEAEDDVANVFHWLWSLKDHIKKVCKDKNWVESQVNKNPYLCICADLDNASKHGGLERPSRSGKKPKLGRLKYQIPKSAIAQLAFGAFDVKIDVNNAHLVDLEMPILDENNNIIGDAFEYLDKCIEAWESIMQTIQRDQHD